VSFYSPIDRLAQNLPRPKGTGAEFMTELSKMPGYKAQEAEDRGLQALTNLPKMERAQFMEALKAKPPVTPKTREMQTTQHDFYTLPGGENYREILLQHPNPQNKFAGASGHFAGAPNILASVRAKDRVGPNGEKILHIDELQSDWHQQGREHGYRPPGQSELLTGEPYKIAENEYGIKWSDGSVDDAGYSERYANGLAERGKLTEKVPDAPFKKNWHEMALKKMIHHAAANGYDSIAITPGAEQAKRYGLSKQVGRVAHMTHIDNLNKGILFVFDPKGNQIVENHNVFHKDLPRYIGKEGTEKLLEQKPDEHGYRELSGQNLEFGGEGMKGFYDKIVPNFLNQFGKKYGAKVSTKQLPIEGGIEPGWVTKPAAPREVPVHHFPITPEMREDVTKNGVPLYADGGPVPPLRPLSPQLAALREQMAQQSALNKAYDEAMKNVYTNQMPTFAQWVASQGKAKGGKVSRAEHDANLAKFLSESKIKDRLYHATPANFNEFKPGGHNPRISGHAIWLGADPSHLPAAHHIGDPKNPKTGVQIMPVHVQVKKPMVLDDKDMLEWAQAAYAGGSKEFPELMPKEWADKVKEDYDSIIHADPHGRGDPHEVIVFHPSQIKSAIGNRGMYDTSKSDMTKAKGGAVKPVGYTKEQVTVSPNLDAMRYELMSVKRYTKKVK